MNCTKLRNFDVIMMITDTDNHQLNLENSVGHALSQGKVN